MDLGGFCVYLGGFGWIWVDLGGFWVGMMDGGEILGRNASMASQELRIGKDGGEILGRKDGWR